MSTAVLVKELKKAGEDHEFYPTTQEIIEWVHFDLRTVQKTISIMDIGAGDGNFFKVLSELESSKEKSKQNQFKKYAIEKSMILIDKMPADIFIVGTDFHEQSFIDKKMDVIFCNPPYSEYAEWMDKIIQESNAHTVYMVVPDRWKKNEKIAESLKTREANANTIKEFTFKDSEYRKANTSVDLVRITFHDISYGNDFRLKVDPFDVWFDKHFNVTAEKTDDTWHAERTKSENLHQLVKGQNIIERLAELYQEYFQHLLGNYKAVELLDSEILEELGVSVSGLKGSLKSKIEGLKNLYWQELFNNLDKITDRLTAHSRKALVKTLTAHTSVDFTASNAYSVVIWAIKNSNKYFNSQLLAVYLNITKKENVVNYKSNHRIIKDDWRYSRNEWSHYVLDYRIVHNHYNAIMIEGTFGTYDYHQGLSKSAHETISDIITVAKNLGFNIVDSSWNMIWKAGQAQYFYYRTESGDLKDFASIKAHKNGNLHFKFNQRFMKKWNIEAARLNGWIKSPAEAAEEMKDMSLQEAAMYFKSNRQLLSSDIKLLA